MLFCIGSSFHYICLKKRLNYVTIFLREHVKKRRRLSLYNAVNNSHYTDPSAIDFTTIKDVMYLGMHRKVQEAQLIWQFLKCLIVL